VGTGYAFLYGRSGGKTVTYRRLLIIALIAGLPSIGQAQFTTFIAPQNKVADSVKAVVAVQQKAQADSVAKLQITNMKTWVDSAAGVLPAPSSSTASDSVAMTMPPTPAAVPQAASTPPAATVPAAMPPASAADSAFTNGTRAPATATNFPMLLVLGGLMVFTGAVLTGAKPKVAEARARNDRHS
jgi:hypothetical protein